MRQLENDKSNKKAEAATEKEVIFSKEQLIKSKTFVQYRDLLTVIINDGEKVTKQEVNKRIEAFLKRKVK